MPTPVSAPSFIHLEMEDHPSPPHRSPRTSPHTAALDHAVVSLRRFTISRDRHHHPHPSPHKRRGRPANSRVRGKHGIVKAVSSYARSSSRRSGVRSGSSPSNDTVTNNAYSFSRETRTTLLRSYMQSRRLRLRQRLSCQSDEGHLDSSDMSLDEDEALDDQAEDSTNVFLSNPEQHRRHLWELEQRLLEKTESATKSRSHFLMERRVSAGERVDHVLRVVQRRRTEQEMRQHKVRDELEQKMMRAMARRKEFLEAAIENDPSRRFRRKSASSNAAVVSERTRDRVRGSSSFSVAVAGLEPERLSLRRPVVVDSAAATTTTSPIIHSKAALVTATTPNITERGQDEGQGPKNSGRMDIMKWKSHLTSMTSRSISPSTAANDLILDDSIIKSSPSDIEDKGASVDNLGLERTIVWAQRRIRTRLVQKASHEYMRAIGGSHQRVLAMGFEDLARLLHSNKALVQAALRFLKYSSQLAQMDKEPSQRTKRAYKNPGRVLLSMYMVLAHPNQIRSPSETSASATGHHDNDAFEALVESSKALLEALQTWMAANLKSQDDSTVSENENANDSATTRSSHSTADSQRNAALVRSFDQAWTSYFGFFEAWKNKDARRLLETLLEHARQLEALWRTVQSDAMARVEWQPRIEEQRRDLRAKAGQLAGPGGVARLDSVFADFVTTTTTTTTANSTGAAPDTDSAMSDSNHAPESHTRASTTVEDAVMEKTLTSTPGAKKRQRNASVSQSDTAMAPADQASDTLATASRSVNSNLMSAEGNTGSSAVQEPLPKKPATANPSAGTSTAKKAAKESTADSHLTFELPTGFAKPEKWSNLRMLHEVALDPSLRIEQAPQGPDTDLVQRIEAMATKAYFDSIREDAAKGELGKWIPSILTSIRMQLLDMIPPGSATAHRVAEAFDLEFVQQQVDRKVYDVKAALEGVLDIMSKLCAPIRDPSIRQLQEDLQQVSQPPFQTEQGTSSSSSGPAPKYTATSVSPKDLVSVLQGILELLEQMLMDMANFRLIAARPKLEQQAIPYEQDAFKTMLADGETSLEATTAWLQASATRFLSSKSTSPPSSPSVTAATSSSSPGSGSPGSPSAKNGNRHYEVFANAVLDLLFAKKAVETLGKNDFPETFELDRMRLTRYQNEIQALLLVAVMMNLAFNSAPLVKAGEWSEELKSTLFKLMELSGTTKGQFADAIIEAKEKALLIAARSGSSSSSSVSGSNPSSPTPPASTVPVSHLLLTEDKKRSLHTSIAKAVSFDSPLYTVIAQRVRKVLEGYLTSTSASGGMPDRAALNKVGLGFLEGELEVIAKPIRFLVKYNAKVYQQWYDPILAKALTRASETLSKASKEAVPASASAPLPTSSSSSSSSSSTSSDSR